MDKNIEHFFRDFISSVEEVPLNASVEVRASVQKLIKELEKDILNLHNSEEPRTVSPSSLELSSEAISGTDLSERELEGSPSNRLSSTPVLYTTYTSKGNIQYKKEKKIRYQPTITL